MAFSSTGAKAEKGIISLSLSTKASNSSSFNYKIKIQQPAHFLKRGLYLFHDGHRFKKIDTLVKF